MKRRNLFLVATFLLSFFMVNAQNTQKGDKIVSLGLGFGNNYTSGGDEFSISFLPISASFEYIIKDELFSNGKGALGIGAFAQYMNYNYEVTNNSNTNTETTDMAILKSALAGTSANDWKYKTFIFGPRGYLHYSLLDNLDTYTGLMLGLDHVSWGTGNDNYNETTLAFAWFLGGRYYFNDILAGMLELGYGPTYLNIGIAYKFAN